MRTFLPRPMPCSPYQTLESAQAQLIEVVSTHRNGALQLERLVHHGVHAVADGSRLWRIGGVVHDHLVEIAVAHVPQYAVEEP